MLIEAPCPRVGNEGKRQPPFSRLMRRRVDQSPADSSAPQVRLDEQPVELAANHGREAGNFAIELGDDYLVIRDLRRGQIDCLGIVDELVAILWQLERGSAQQVFKLVMLVGPGEPQRQAVSAI